MKNRIEKLINNNLKYLEDFENALIKEGLSKQTIQKHVGNVAFYIVDYLNRSEPLTVQQGILEMDYFFSKWFAKKAMWASKNTYKENFTSLKKFYKFLNEIDAISREDYEKVVSIITNNKEKWLNIIETYDLFDNEEADLEEDDLSYFLDSGMLDEDESNSILNDFYKLAKGILKEKPWTFLSSTDVIEISVPGEDEKLYASVLGEAGESFGIIFYQGSLGLKSFLRLLSSEEHQLEQIMISQSYIALHYDEANQLNPIDEAFLSMSEVTFEDKNKLPFLRVQDPGILACPLEVVELIDLSVVVELLIKAFKYLKKNKQYRDWFVQDQIFSITKAESGEMSYSFKDMDTIFNENMNVAMFIDELAMKKLKKKVKKNDEVWEIGQTYLPTPIFDEDSEYLAHFPSLFAVLEHSSGEVKGTQISEPMASNKEFQTYFYEMVMASKQYPQKILINDDALLTILYPILVELQIEIEFDEALVKVAEFIGGMMTHMGISSNLTK